MNKKIMAAIVWPLFLLSYASHAIAQDQGRADIKNAQEKSVGTAFIRETKDGAAHRCKR